jgi:maltose phosphorylase
MNKYIKHSEWEIIEEDFNPDNQQNSESIFSLGNGKMGHRANFEEYYSGHTLQGSYISGIYYPDKTRVGWWKNGYPNYFAKIINAPDWRGIKISVNKQKLDLFKCKISDFKRVLNMKHGYLYKSYTAELNDGKKLKIESLRFLSIVNDELGVIKYTVKPLNFSGTLQIILDIDANVKNKDANYGEKFWTEVEKSFLPYPFIITETKKTFFHVCNAFASEFEIDGENFKPSKYDTYEFDKYVGYKFYISLNENQTLTIYKYAAVTTSLYYTKDNLLEPAFKILENAINAGFDQLIAEQKNAWEQKWAMSDIVIEGDVAAQQAIRFNIFQLQQSYSGKDERLNIGPKGFTGEKYGGVTYWDTEAYCLPFYLSTHDSNVARNLLIYRYKHLQKAIENAQKLGFSAGAALFPMVTINGEECHNEWEITFEEIHRNGAIAYAIYNYVRYTDDKKYLADYGLEVLIAISRFWAQRVNFSEDKQKYVMLGVTGPNEYENNVNNNWYTSTIALWTMKYTMETLKFVENNYPQQYNQILEKTKFDLKETDKWQHIIKNMYLPYDEKRKIFLQQDGFLDKELKTADQIPQDQRPINKHWSWDKILRSCYIKQADVLQGLFFFEENYDIDTIKRNFDFYEPMTVHESSLSPSIYSIIASKIGNEKKAYELYYRTARLDLDDYNAEVSEGLHVTSMAGTWMSLVYGFGGLRIKNQTISFDPFLPNNWKKFAFKIKFRHWLLNIQVSKKEIIIANLSNKNISILLYGEEYKINANDEIIFLR